MNYFKLIAFTLAATLLTADLCAAESTSSAASDAIPQNITKRLGRIYIYRDASFFGKRLTPEILINNDKVGLSTSGSYLFANKKPGQYNISFEGNDKEPVSVVVTGGESQYVQASISKGLLSDTLKLRPVSEAAAQTAIAKLKYTGKAPLRSLAEQNQAEAAIAMEEIQKVEFHLGRSSYAVEKMANEQGCHNDDGASLITEKGPVEVYRMHCGGGKIFMARCELRQCAQMKH